MFLDDVEFWGLWALVIFLFVTGGIVTWGAFQEDKSHG